MDLTGINVIRFVWIMQKNSLHLEALMLKREQIMSEVKYVANVLQECHVLSVKRL
jgi:hypothetical protein